jgi:dethiobiotin synthetase
MSAFFITATGTDIGKTYVTAGLLRHLRAEGAAAIKPVASGFTAETAAVSDPVQLLEAMGEAVTAETLAHISPWRFAEPLSPDMAAAREGRVIDYEALIAFCRARIAKADGPFFVEGVGGVMVPLDARHTVRDWMAALGLPVVLVAGSYLGTISHTLTALDVLARARLAVAALVVNETPNSAVPLEETMATLSRFAGAFPIVALRRDAAEGEFAALWRVLRPAQ